MLSGFNTLVDCVAIGLFGCGVGAIVFILNKTFPPFKKFFDKLVNGEL